MKIALYLRFSSSNQQETSIEAQRRECEVYCARNNHQIVKEYVDREKSAFKNIEKRTSFLEMISDSKDHLFNGILVYSLDRFSRDKYETAIYEYELKKNNVKLISVVENTDDTPQGELTKGIFQTFAQYYSQELSQKVKRGMLQTQIDHLSTGGRCVLGYKVIDKRFVLDDNTAPIVQEIFERFDNGTPISVIANDLNERNIKTNLGGKFNRSSFHNLLKNKKYIGIYSYKDKSGNIIEDEDAIPRIISDDLFYRVQDKLKNAPRKPRINMNEFLLSGLVQCQCGHKMYGDTPTNHQGKKYYYYYCKECSARISRDVLDNEVVETLSQLMNDDKKKELAQIMYEENQNDSVAKYIEQLEQDLETTKKDYKKYLDTITRLGLDDECAMEVADDYKVKIKNIQIEIAKERPKSMDYPLSEYELFINQLFDKNVPIDRFRKNLVVCLVKKIIIIDNNNIDIYIRNLHNEDSKVRKSFQWWCYSTNSRTYRLWL